MVDSQHFFLTYPQSDLDNQHVIDEIIRILEGVDNELEWARCCKELHDDGQPHHHIVFKCKRRCQIRGQRGVRLWDINGRHPNIQSVRSVFKSLEYAAKDGDYIDYGEIPVPKAKRAWADIMEAAKGPEVDWLQCVHEERMGPHVAKRVRELCTSESVDLDEYDDRPIQNTLSIVPQEFTSMCIVGPPAIGKTGWAMLHMPRPCLLVKHKDCLREFRVGYHKSILFDDCDFKYLNRSEQLQLCDYENQVQIHARWGVAKIPAHTKRLFLCNPGCEPFINDPAIQGRRLTTFYV